MGALIGFLVISFMVGGIICLVQGKEIANHYYKKDLFSQLEGPTSKSRSKAYLQGYQDMATGAAHFPGTYRKSVKDWNYPHINVKKYVDFPTLCVDKKGQPFYSENSMNHYAEKLLDGQRTLNPQDGRINRVYLGGSETEFQDYYAGGTRFLADVDEAKRRITDKRLEDDKKNQLIYARMRGLKEIDAALVKDMQELDKMRKQTFETPLNEHEIWNKQMREIQ